MDMFYSAQTNVGNTKQTNQDSIMIKSSETSQGRFTLLSVCDGMGGLSSGEVASATVSASFARWFEAYLRKDFKFLDSKEISEQWNLLIFDSNNRLQEYGRSNGIKLGTTCTVMLVAPEFYLIGHVGDTRVYEVNEGINLITEDQTFVNREVKEGRMTLEQAMTDSRRNVLLQCIGATRTVMPQFIVGKVSLGSVYFICSDGFRHLVSNDEFVDVYNPNKIISNEMLDRASRELINMNMQREETDNISVVAIKVY